MGELYLWVDNWESYISGWRTGRVISLGGELGGLYLGGELAELNLGMQLQFRKYYLDTPAA